MTTALSLISEILEPYRGKLARDFVAYSNHCQRVALFCLAIVNDESLRDKIAIASAFHDLGIWTDKTFDYLAPSERLASDYLKVNGKNEWNDEIVEAIENHHKVTGYHGKPTLMVDPFRKADWLDVSLGSLTFGLSRSFIKEVRAAFPNEGFHRRLIQLGFERAASHPLSPLPMIKF